MLELTHRAARPKETDLQPALIQYLDAVKPDAIYYSTPNEGTYKNRGLRKAGVRPGVPDLTFAGMPKCPLAYIELKRAGGVLSAAQEKFIIEAGARGIPAYVVESDDPEEIRAKVINHLTAWGAL